jgi:hypothetical protein
MQLSAKQFHSSFFWLLLLLTSFSFSASSKTLADNIVASTNPQRVDSELASLARDQIRAAHHKRFLQQQQESRLVELPNSFVFDYPPNQTQGQITQIFWNEPEALFALINLGRKQNILPGHLLHYYKSPNDSGGAMVVLQTFENRSYVMILQAHLVPAVNDQVR